MDERPDNEVIKGNVQQIRECWPMEISIASGNATREFTLAEECQLVRQGVLFEVTQLKEGEEVMCLLNESGHVCRIQS